MTWLKLLIITVLFFALAVLQTGFFPHVAVLGFSPNLVFALFFTVIFFEDPQEYAGGFFCVLAAGFLLDAFSPYYFGTAMLSLFIIYILFKAAVHFLSQMRGKYLLAYFAALFLIFFSFYSVLMQGLVGLPHISIGFPPDFFAALAYNLAFAAAMFFGYAFFARPQANTRQLRLFK